MDTQPPGPGPSGSKCSRLAGTSSNTLLIGTHQDHRHQLVNRNTANAATKHMTQDAHFNIVCKTGSSTNKKQLAVGFEYIHTVVNSSRLTVYHTVGVHRELRDQILAARNGKPPWSTKAFTHTVRQIDHLDVVSSGISPDKFPDKYPREWTKYFSFTLEEDTETYMVEVIAASHCLKRQLISCWNSTCLLQWQDEEVVFSWNSPTCAWP